MLLFLVVSQTLQSHDGLLRNIHKYLTNFTKSSMVMPKVETYFRASLMDCTTKVCRCLYSAPALTGLTAVQRTRHGRAPLVYCTTKVQSSNRSSRVYHWRPTMSSPENILSSRQTLQSQNNRIFSKHYKFSTNLVVQSTSVTRVRYKLGKGWRRIGTSENHCSFCSRKKVESSVVDVNAFLTLTKR